MSAALPSPTGPADVHLRLASLQAKLAVCVRHSLLASNEGTAGASSVRWRGGCSQTADAQATSTISQPAPPPAQPAAPPAAAAPQQQQERRGNFGVVELMLVWRRFLRVAGPLLCVCVLLTLSLWLDVVTVEYRTMDPSGHIASRRDNSATARHRPSTVVRSPLERQLQLSDERLRAASAGVTKLHLTVPNPKKLHGRLAPGEWAELPLHGAPYASGLGPFSARYYPNGHVPGRPGSAVLRVSLPDLAQNVTDAVETRRTLALEWQKAHRYTPKHQQTARPLEEWAAVTPPLVDVWGVVAALRLGPGEAAVGASVRSVPSGSGELTLSFEFDAAEAPLTAAVEDAGRWTLVAADIGVFNDTMCPNLRSIWNTADRATCLRTCEEHPAAHGSHKCTAVNYAPVNFKGLCVLRGCDEATLKRIQVGGRPRDANKKLLNTGWADVARELQPHSKFEVWARWRFEERVDLTLDLRAANGMSVSELSAALVPRTFNTDTAGPQDFEAPRLLDV